jgi:hypothetical protein
MPDAHAIITIDNGSEHRWTPAITTQIEALAYGSDSRKGFCTTGHEYETEGDDTIDDWSWVRLCPTTPEEFWLALSLATAIHAVDGGATCHVVVERPDHAARSCCGTERLHDAFVVQVSVDRGIVTGRLADAVRDARRILTQVEGVDP